MSSGLLLFPVECHGLIYCRGLCRVSCRSLEKVCGRISSPLRLVTVKSLFALAAGFSLLCVLLPLSGCPRLHSRTFSVLSKFICSGGEKSCPSLTQRAAANTMGTGSFSPHCSASAFQSNTAHPNREQNRTIHSSNFQGSLFQFIIPTEHLP